MDTVTALMAEMVAGHGNDTAIIYHDEPITYAELDDMSRRAATVLADLGVGPGDRVALWLPNCPAYVALCLGCCRLGAIAVAVNTRFRSTEVSDIVSRVGAEIMVMWPGFREIDFLALLAEAEPEALACLKTIILYDEGQKVDEIPTAVAHCRRLHYNDLIQCPPYDDDHGDPDAGCKIFTTSGTTKAPKFVLHSQGSISRHARLVADGFGYSTSQGALLQMMPLCGVFGFSQIMAGLASGQPTVLTASFDPIATVELAARHNVVNFNATDDMIQSILDNSPLDKPLPNVRFVGSAAFATNYAELAARAEARGIRMVGLYGMSEVQALYALQPMDLPLLERIVGGGKPIAPASKVRVRDPDSGELLGPGEAGELEISGPSLMKEYYLNPEATAEEFTDDGYLRTGDLAEMTADGRFLYLQRMGDVLRLGGFLTSPAEIENQLIDHDSVADSQVVGVTTADGSVRAVGFVILHDGADFHEDILRQHCLENLARFKAPVRIFPLDEFPTTQSANGTKIQRAALRRMAEERVNAVT
ncbi:MAG: AMP-binding protein [Rhodospirillaceae bacterium]|jgi:fatty-acyl-CoA synthase|nr:AMP-binding protein [Rhodospirillaceae bacterium]MBT5082831.1 AMP-binding protein [Rhodospirillaceae bacterium]MBT5524275.1 AMP-binding protein [Rhodospirillaceae bacterium]MBT5878931.1 AMP-binding protein [Rhodospirillaceae bacterium]MBT6591922.1 AMP-binding protein [Rhodospirillaceae bacterium]